MKTILKIIFIFPIFILSQESGIIIDGQFNDWENIYSINDMPNENYEGVNFTSISVTNDNNYL